MIKLIASDIDGTLLVEGSDRINPRLYDVVLKLKEKGIIFAAASGRQYHSIRHVFAPIEKDMIFICENGSNVICRGYDMSSTVLNKKDARDLIAFIHELPEDCYPVVSTKGPMYVEDKDPEFLDWLLNGYHNEVRVVDDILKENLEIIKISIFRKKGAAEIAPPIIKQWENRFHVTLAGEPWLDFMDYKAGKGNAIETIQELLHIKKEETMAFGDNYNDIGMLERAGESYAVANAQIGVKEAAKHIADTNVNDGVLKVLETLL